MTTPPGNQPNASNFALLLIPGAIIFGETFFMFVFAMALAPDLGWFPAALIALALAAVSIFIYSRIVSTARAENEILVERPLPQVFDFVATNYFANRPQWSNLQPSNSEMIISEQTTPGPMHAGATGRLVIGQPTHNQEWRVNVREYVVNREFTVRSFATPGAIEIVMALKFIPAPSGTRILTTHTMKVPPLQGLLNILWSHNFAATMAYSDDLLKSAIERALPT